MRVVVSLCNQERTADRGLLLFDLDRAEGTWLPVGAEAAIMGTRGTCVDGSLLYTVYTVGWAETHVAWYDASAPVPVLLGDLPLPDVADPHSICIFDRRLLVASTGSDEVIAYDLTDGAPDEVGETFWRASDEGTDMHHVNGVCTDGTRVLVSAFGARIGEFWSSAEHGYVVDALTGDPVFADIYHPHSIRIFDGMPHVVESSRQGVRAANGETIVVGGYVRGLDRLPDGTLLVGTNVARRVSRSRGVVTNNTNPENPEGQRVGAASLVRIAPSAAPRREFLDLGGFGTEIYDVCVLPSERST